MNQIRKRKVEVGIAAFTGTFDVKIKGKEHIKHTS